MDIGDRVKVAAPGHLHDGMEGQIVAVETGDTPHIEVDDEARAQPDKRVAQNFSSFDEAKKKFDKNDASTHIIQGSAGEFFADIVFPDNSVARYWFGQLEEA